MHELLLAPGAWQQQLLLAAAAAAAYTKFISIHAQQLQLRRRAGCVTKYLVYSWLPACSRRQRARMQQAYHR